VSSELLAHAAADALVSARFHCHTKTFYCVQSVLEEVTRQMGLSANTTSTLHGAAAAASAGASIGGSVTAATAASIAAAASSSGVHACNIATALCNIAQRGWITSTGVSDDCSCVVVDLAPLMRRDAADASL
jgi:hypothetical protein